MNREIKFRAWDDLGKSWINWSNEMFKGINSPNEFFEMMDANGCPVQQFTGLKDKNGVEIYEGDILKYFNEQHPKREHPFFSIEWSENCAWVMRYGQRPEDISGLVSIRTKPSRWEVMGNIYENPELLNEK